jgi:hypothetical protein
LVSGSQFFLNSGGFPATVKLEAEQFIPIMIYYNRKIMLGKYAACVAIVRASIVTHATVMLLIMNL